MDYTKDYKIDDEYIVRAINSFYMLISDKKEGAPDTRYRSWEWCYKAFKDGKEKHRKSKDDREKEEIVDYLALHLAFYLASWGMYRGSSYLLQRDYKAHINTVKLLLESKYDTLWGYAPKESDLIKGRSEAAELIFNAEKGLYVLIKKTYKNYEKASEDDASDTLVTKILMGALGCVPAFDRFFKKGIKWLKEKYAEKNIVKKISCAIENGKSYGKTFGELEKLAVANDKALIVSAKDVEYPVMKCVDMFFWQIGYELDLAEALSNKQNAKKHGKLIKKASEMGICEPSDSADTVIKKIEERWK